MVVDEVGVVVDEVVVVLATVVVVVDDGASPGHSAKSIVQLAVQRSAPLGDDWQVRPPKSFVSHSSPGSFTPLPHVGPVVVVVVDELGALVVELVDVDDETGALDVVVLVVVVVVVVVPGVSGAQISCTTRLVSRLCAHAAPMKVAPRPSSSSAFGAWTNARTRVRDENRTLAPSTFSTGVAALPTGPNAVSFCSWTLPVTVIVVCPGPSISMVEFLPAWSEQKVYGPGASVSVAPFWRLTSPKLPGSRLCEPRLPTSIDGPLHDAAGAGQTKVLAVKPPCVPRTTAFFPSWIVSTLTSSTLPPFPIARNEPDTEVPFSKNALRPR